MKISELIKKLADLQAVNGDQDVVIDTGMALCEVDDVDMGASDEGVVVWAGNLVE